MTDPRAYEPRVEPPSPDVDVTGHDAAGIPGTHRGGYQREFTAPVPITESVHTEVEWAPAPPSLPPRSGGWALAFGVMGLLVSLLVGWGFLIGIMGVALAIAAMRRPWESRSIAVWALCLSALSLVYSAGWLWWASTQGPLFG